MPGLNDAAGLNRFLVNVLSGWGAYLVYVISGFILPRLISDNLGQTSLGIWDFSWSIINYLSISDIGVGGSTNRFISRYRTENKLAELNSIASAAFCIQVLLACIVLSMAVLASAQAPVLFADRLDEEAVTAGMVILLLGVSLAAQFVGGAGRGVLTGVHRWDVNNLINGVARIVSMALMIVVLILDYGLVALAATYLVVNVVAEFIRVAVAFKYCPELSLTLYGMRREDIKTLVSFGGKSYILDYAPLIVQQTTAVLVAGVFGPIALAIFSRPVALVRYLHSFIDRFAMIFIPTVGSLQADEELDKVTALFILATRFCVAVCLPITLLIGVFGNQLLYIWMGPGYEAGALCLVLAVGYFLIISQRSAVSVITGLNEHGTMVSIVAMVVIPLYIILLVIIQNSGWSLELAGAAMVIPMALAYGVLLPIHACRVLNLGLVRFFRESMSLALLTNIPVLAIMLGCIYWFEDKLIAMSIAMMATALLLLPIYWLFMLLPEHRTQIVNLLLRKPAR